MSPSLKNAGIAGIFTGLFLAGEFGFFMLSGFSPEKFNNPSTAMMVLRDSELFLRLAVLFGAAGVAVRMIYVAGLAAKLKAKTPTAAVATLYFGILGGVGHGLVALSFYIGIPMFLALAATNPESATNAWGAFTAITSGFQGFGNFLLGLMLMVVGWATISHKVLPVGIGWVAIIAGIATLLGVFTSGTSLAFIGFMVFMPSLILAMIFDIWTGFALLKSNEK